MRFTCDHYFQIGHAHYTAGKPCQDHALSRSSGSLACAIVSDGCSTGGNTDVGSRILTFGTLQAIRDHAKASGGTLATAKISIAARQQQLIGVIRPMIGLERNDMLATCVYAYVTQSGGLIHVQGDGVVAWKYRDGQLFMHRYEWADNTPYYPAYEGRDLQAFIESHGKDLGGKRFKAISELRELPNEKREGKTARPNYEEHFTLQHGIAGHALEISGAELEQIEFLAVFTDGVTQIENVAWQDAVNDFLLFKTTAGEFAKRRMIRGIKESQKLGHGPIDDIAYAVIHIEPGEAKEEDIK